MATVIVTGGTGLLGRHLLSLFSAQGVDVVPLDRPEHDLSSPLDLERLPSRADAIIYLAQSSRFREFPEGASDMFAVNVARVAELLDYATRSGVRNFVHASTGGVYRPSDNVLTEESALADPMGFYPASKRCAELLAQSYESQFNVAVLRYFSIYGPGQRRDMLVPRLIDNVRTGRPITLQGADGLRLSPVHAIDAARAAATAASLGSSATINVAGPDTLSLREIGEAIGRHVGEEPRFALEEKIVPVDYVPDIRRMGDMLGRPSIRFQDRIGELAQP